VLDLAMDVNRLLRFAVYALADGLPAPVLEYGYADSRGNRHRGTFILFFVVVAVAVFVQHFWPLLLIGALAWAGVKFFRFYRRDDSFGAPPPLPSDHYRG